MGKIMILNIGKISISQESDLEDFLEKNGIEYKDEYTNDNFVDITFDCDCDEF